MSKIEENLDPEQRALLMLWLRKKAAQQPRAETPGSSPIKPAARDAELPLSFAQQRLWFLAQLDPGNFTYNISTAIQLDGNLDVKALEQSLRELFCRHEPLRTTFTDVEGRAVQVIGEVPHQVLSFIDLCSLDQPSRRSHLDRIIYDNAHFRFDLAAGPLFIATLVALSHQQFALLLCMHHIISDGWSMRLLVREMSALYEAFSTGKPAAGQRLPVQYADYAVWQREWMSGEALDQELSYWKKELESAPVAIDLPTDHARPATQSYRGGVVAGQIKPEVSEAIRKLSLREGATVFVTMLSAYMVLLSKWSGQEEVVVGTPIAGRNREEIEGVIGMFVNTLAIRGRLGGDVRFDEVMRRVREAALRAYAHQEVPFEKVVEEMRVERDMSRSPVFQVMFAMENIGRERVEIEGLKVSGIGGGNEGAKFELTMYVEEEEGGRLSVRMEYNRDMYEEGTVRRMLKQYEKVIEEVVRDSGKRLRDIEVVEEEEKQKLLFDWNGKQRKYESERSLMEEIDRWAKATPEAIAVRCAERALSYQQLSHRSNQLARHLISLSVGPESLVAICMHRSLELVTALLAILKAGAAYLPLDPAYPLGRLSYMVEDSAVKLIVTDRGLAKAEQYRGVTVVDVTAEQEQISRQSVEGVVSGVTADNLAYVIYTSGSTGKPKGVMISHRGLMNYLRWIVEAYEIEKGEGAPLHSPIGFDLTITALFGSLMAGRRVDIVTEEEGVEGLARSLMEQREYSLVKLTPAHMKMLGALLGEAISSELARAMIIGGEALYWEDLKAWQERAPETRLINEYGPTEAVVGCSVYDAKESSAAERSVPIGRPIDNVELYVLDKAARVTPIGVVGELYIGGASQARGYIGRPDQTAERFVPDGVSGGAGKRLYRTGDLCRWRADGNLEYVGRADDQVKVRGYRIELGEIESALKEHEAVRECAVIVDEGASDKKLVAYVSFNDSNDGKQLDGAALQDYLRNKLPDYMTPTIFVTLDTIPVNANGKVDRRALPRLSDERLATEARYVAPRDTMELRLARIWEDLLGAKQVGINDNFFELGGHSILAARLLSRIQKEFKTNLPLRTLFKEATIARLAAVLRQPEMAISSSPLVAIQPEGSRPPLFLAHPSGGGVLCYRELAHSLDPDQPLYGLQDPSLEGDEEPLGDIEAMASRYVAAIREARPRGPYLLGGYSFGGVIAFQMAQELIRQGQTVALLVFIESMSPVDSKEILDLEQQMGIDESLLLALNIKQDARVAGVDLELSFSHLLKLEPDARTTYVMGKVRAANLLPPEIGLDAFRRYMRLHWSRREAIQRYRPSAYPGKITLFRTKEQITDDLYDLLEITQPSQLNTIRQREDEAFRDHSLRWDALTEQPVEVQFIPGNHHTVLRAPNVQTLAEQLEDCIDRVSLITAG